jgi:hypothetical protein
VSPDKSPCLALLQPEQLLQLYAAAFHSGHFNDGSDSPMPVREAGLLDDQVDARGNVLAHGGQGQVHAGHQYHGFQS